MIDNKERDILTLLESLLSENSIQEEIDSLCKKILKRIEEETESDIIWEPIQMSLLTHNLPAGIRSGWIFAIRSNTVTGAERHPHSHQRMMSYRGEGDLQIWNGGKWLSNKLSSERSGDFSNRWVSISPNTWHQVEVGKREWIVASFHSVPAEDLIEERADSDDFKSTRQKKYIR